MPKGNREAKKPKKEKPKTTAAAASAKGTGSATEEVASVWSYGASLLNR